MPDIYQLRKQLLVSISRRPRNETRIDLPWCTFVSRATGCSDSRSIFVSFFFSFFRFCFLSSQFFERTAGQSIGNGRQRAVDTSRDLSLKCLLPSRVI